MSNPSLPSYVPKHISLKQRMDEAFHTFLYVPEVSFKLIEQNAKLLRIHESRLSCRFLQPRHEVLQLGKNRTSLRASSRDSHSNIAKKEFKETKIRIAIPTHRNYFLLELEPFVHFRVSLPPDGEHAFLSN